MSEAASYAQQPSQGAAAGNWTQDGRLIAIETPLGKDKLLLTSLAGEETISRLFAYELEMLSPDHAISPESLIGRNVKVVITSEDGKTRPIHGMVAEFRAGPLAGRELRQYSAHVVPWLWYLGHSTDCRIFQNLNVPDIIDQVFKTFGFTDYQLSVARGDYPKLEFCVQYRETALNFVSRLMEEVGIFYFFRHDKDRHVLMIADRNVSFMPAKEFARVQYEKIGKEIAGEVDPEKKAALEANDRTALQAKAHYLKNSADVLDATALANQCRALEEAAPDAPYETLTDLIANIEKLAEALIPQSTNTKD